jgi:hypothetical protein
VDTLLSKKEKADIYVHGLRGRHLVMFVGTFIQWRHRRPMFRFNWTKKSFKESKPLLTWTKCRRLRMLSILPILALPSVRNDERFAPSPNVVEKSIKLPVVQEEGLSQTWPPFYFPLPHQCMSCIVLTSNQSILIRIWIK